MINIFTTAHLSFFKTAFFGKADIFNLAGLGPFQIVFRCKAAVKTDLERIAIIDLFLPVQHRDRQICIGRIAFHDQAVQDQIRSSAGQAYLVTKNRVPAVFDDNVGVWLEDGYHLFLSRNTFTQQHTTLGLADNLLGKICIVLNVGKSGNIVGSVKSFLIVATAV